MINMLQHVVVIWLMGVTTVRRRLELAHMWCILRYIIGRREGFTDL